MADIVSPEVRSRMMSGIRGKDTKPELIIRRGLHARGFRYRLHDKHLPGRPDLVLPKYQAVIFVHGCFWHGHDCHLFKWPSTRVEFWREKIEGNQKRDRDQVRQLRHEGWRVRHLWECQLKGKPVAEIEKVISSVSEWLNGGGK